jgi:hypothetical protein
MSLIIMALLLLVSLSEVKAQQQAALFTPLPNAPQVTSFSLNDDDQVVSIGLNGAVFVGIATVGGTGLTQVPNTVGQFNSSSSIAINNQGTVLATLPNYQIVQTTFAALYGTLPATAQAVVQPVASMAQAAITPVVSSPVVTSVAAPVTTSTPVVGTVTPAVVGQPVVSTAQVITTKNGKKTKKLAPAHAAAKTAKATQKAAKAAAQATAAQAAIPAA